MNKTIDVANVLLQNQSNEILLLQRSPLLKRPYIWGLPGGMIDIGEDALDAATRELVEETGIRESSIVIGGVKRFLVEMPDERVKICSVRATVLEDDVEVIIDPNEHVDFRWISPRCLYGADDLLPGLPTMIARSLGDNPDIQDRTVRPDIRIVSL